MSSATPETKLIDNRPPVIRDLRGVHETSTQRLLRKHLPAWVISGVLNVSLMASLITFDRMMGQPPALPVDDAELTVVADNDQEEAPEPEDLLNPVVGLDAMLPAVVDAERIEDVNIEATILSDESPGIETAMEAPSIDFTPPAAIGDIGIDPGLEAGILENANIGSSGGGSGALINAAMQGRNSATKSKLLSSGGGNTESEAAVARALTWLAKQQSDASGAWQYDGERIQQPKLVAATGMALLPFLAAGQTHKYSKDNTYRKHVADGIAFLISHQHPTGRFYNSLKVVRGGKVTFVDPVEMYDQAIATIALCEALGMTNDRSLLLRPCQAAVNFIQQAQASDGSWGYRPNILGDSSIVGWEIQALHSAKLCKDLAVNNTVLKKATEFLASCSNDPLQAKYGYKKGSSPKDSLTAVGLLCRYYLDGWGRRTPGMAAGVDYLLKEHTPTGEMDMYYYYYATQVMHFYEGDEWFKQWNPKMRDRLVKLQETEKGPNYGSWNDENDKYIGAKCGRVGMTAMTLLTLEVYYRHLPLYNRDNGGMKELERLK